MKTHLLTALPLFIAATLLMSSCKVDFSPNADWQEIPVVYCVLDQDDDTIWARVQRCYLPNGDINEPAMVTDSINFPIGYIDVKILSLRSNGTIDTLQLNDTVCNIDQGTFVNTSQPMYYCVPKRKLDSTCTYKLIVTKTTTGEVIAQSTTQLITKTKRDLLHVSRGRIMFSFYGNGNTWALAWYNLNNARRYEPIVRFYYSQNGDTLYKDISCGSMVEHRSAEQIQSMNYSRYTFLKSLKEAIGDDTTSKQYLKVVDVYITGCTEELNAYINSSNSSGIEQSHNNYTNIDGGLGVFAARRTHLYQRIDADSANAPGSLYSALSDLNIGF